MVSSQASSLPAAFADRVSIHELEGGIVHVELNRPEKLNAFDRAMVDAVVAAGEQVAQMTSARCVILSGKGRAFSAGIDVKSFMVSQEGVDALLSPLGEGPANLAQQTAWTWRQVPVPVIAAVHGVCFGAGLQVALGADIRLVHPDARMSVMEVKWGLIPDMAATQTLRDIVRLDVAKELTFTGREVGGEEAVRLGLATRVAADPLEAARGLAREIAGRSPEAIRFAKELYDRSRRLPEAEGLALEAQLQRRVIGSANQLEAVMANVQKRRPSFGDLE